MVGREQHLHRHTGQVVDLRDRAVEAAAEGAAAKLLDLLLVLAADEGAVEDDQVVEVAMRVRFGEVGRASQQRRCRCRLAVAVVAEDELLVEELRVVIAADLDVGAQ